MAGINVVFVVCTGVVMDEGASASARGFAVSITTGTDFVVLEAIVDLVGGGCGLGMAGEGIWFGLVTGAADVCALPFVAPSPPEDAAAVRPSAG